MQSEQEVKKLRSKEQSNRKKAKNVIKYLGIAQATKGHESKVNQARADKLALRYGFVK